MITEEPVNFKNRAGQELYGVAHIPCTQGIEKTPAPLARVGVIFLNPGPQYRTAHHRLYVHLARKLARDGFYALRFDPAGFGESEGAVTPAPLAGEVMLFDLFASINEGLFINDTIDSVTFFIHKYELDKVILIGLCGGAMTALLAAPLCQKLSALILLSFPVFFSPLEALGNTVDSSYDRNTLKNYLVNLVSFRKESLCLWAALIEKIKEIGLPQAADRCAKALTGSLRKGRPSLHPCFNNLFLNPLERVKKQIPISFIFGEHDKWRFYFEVEFEQKLLKKNKEKNYRKCIIKGEDHLFTVQESQDEIVNIILGLFP